MWDRRPSSASNLQNTKQIYKPLLGLLLTNPPPPGNFSICLILTGTLVRKRKNQKQTRPALSPTNRTRVNSNGWSEYSSVPIACLHPRPTNPCWLRAHLPVHCTGNQLPRQPQSPAACLSVKTNFVLHVTRNLVHPSMKANSSARLPGPTWCSSSRPCSAHKKWKGKMAPC